MEGKAVRGAAAHAGQARQLCDEILDRGREHPARLVVVAATTDRDDELEPRSMRLYGLVDEVSAVSQRVGTGNRQPEPGAQPASPGLVAAAEALEEVVDESRRHPVAAVLDDEPEVTVVPRCGHQDRGGAVPQRVGHE